MKQCFKCGLHKELSDFYKHPKMADGHLGKCIDCSKKDAKQYRTNKIDYYREWDVKRSKTPERRAYEKRRYRAWCLKYPEREKVHTITSNAIRDGRLIRQVCQICGNKAEAHHPDYSRPLEVVWLCKIHHEEVHHMVD